MAGATSKLSILIEAKNQASGQIKQVQSDLKGLDSAASTLAGGLTGLLGAAGVAGFGALAVSAGSAVVEMTRAAAEAERLGTAFNSLAASAGQSGDAMLAAMNEAAQGTISNSELMASANRAMLLGVADSAGEMAQLLDVAAARGKAMGASTAQAFSDLVTGLGRMSPMILDNLGITIDAEKAFQEYAESVGTTAEKLTDAQKKQILLNEVLADSAEIIKANKDAGADLATSFERYEAAVTNAKEALGDAFGGPTGMALALLTDYIHGQTAMLESEKDAAEGLFVALKNLATGSHQVTSSVLEMAEAEGQADDVTRRLTFGLPALGSAAKQAADGMSGAELAAEHLKSRLAELQAQSDATSAALAGISSAAIGAIHSAASAAVGIMPASEIAKIYGENTKQINAQVKAMEAVGMTQDEIDFKTQEMAKKASLPFDIAVEAAREAEKANNHVAASVDALSQEYSDLESAVQGVLQGALDPGVGVDPADLLPRPDAINEDARRLADVAVNGWASPWADYFKTEFPDLFKQMTEGSDIKTAAAQMLQDFQDGLKPELLDKEAAKERVRRMLIGDQNMAALATEIAGELAAEMGIPMQQALAAAQGTLGTGEGMGTTAAASFAEGAAAALDSGDGGGAFVTKFTEQMRAKYSLLATAGTDAAKTWGEAFLAKVGDSVPPALVNLLTDLVTPQVVARMAQQGTLTGATP